MVNNSQFRIHNALNDFYKARRKAGMEEILARLQGKSVALLSYDEIRSKLGGMESSVEHVEDIPLQSIIGSVSRVSDFSRSFLPLKDSDSTRWSMVKIVLEESSGLPPVQVYQIGNVYFVSDGHHRISVAREMGATYIQAYVTKVNTTISFNPDDHPDEVILQAEYQNFIKKTRIDQLIPDANIRVSVPGMYPELLDHISVHRYYMGMEQKREIPFTEAVLHWYENVYLPIAQIILARRMLREFPDRTEADLYLWMMAHRVEIGESLGWKISPFAAAVDLEKRFSRHRVRYFLSNFTKLIFGWLIPGPLEISPAPGEWRRSRGDTDPSNTPHLFEHILVVVNGQPSGWNVVDYAAKIALHEGAWLNGLHITRNQNSRSDRSVQIKAEFEQHCTAAGVYGGLAIESGTNARQISKRSFWNDLTVVQLKYPPPSALIPRLNSGFRLLIRQCYSPLLAVGTNQTFNLQRILLAYDGSPKANEALYVAAYLSISWDAELVVLTTMDNLKLAEQTNQQARDYLETQGIKTSYIVSQGKPAPDILEKTQTKSIDLIIMGSYGGNLLKEIFLGSTVDRVLEASQKPVLICR